MTEMEKLFEKMLNMEMTNREIYEQCRNVAHKPMTNEEWLQTCNTEQLAEVLSNIAYSSALRWNDVLVLSKEMENRKWVEWLKQPHTIKE